MNAIKFETTIDETVAGALPELRPMLGRRVEVIAFDAIPGPDQRRSLSFDDFLTQRLKRPSDVEPVSQEEIDQAIGRGAVGDDV